MSRTIKLVGEYLPLGNEPGASAAHEFLKTAADALIGTPSDPSPTVLYASVNNDLDKQIRGAASELLIAAWYYLRNRYPDEVKQPGALLQYYTLLGYRLLELLARSNDQKNGDLCKEIDETLSQIARKFGISHLSNKVESYKLRSRGHRKKALENSDPQLAAKEFEQSRNAIEEAITYLKDLGAPDPKAGGRASAGEIALAEQLADCWGILGGVYRAQGDLSRAIEAYDRGYIYESNKRFNILNTYNRVNRLVVRLLQSPELLSDPSVLVTDATEQKTMTELLAETAEEIERQLREGRPDRAWALADLAMVRLLGGQDGVEIALNALDESSRNDPFPYQSMLNVIRELAQRQLPVKDKLITVGERLRQKLPESMRGEPLASG